MNNPVEQMFELRDEIFTAKMSLLYELNDFNSIDRNIDYYMDYGHLNLNFGRQTGNSTWLKYKVRQLEYNGCKTISLFSNNDMQKRIFPRSEKEKYLSCTVRNYEKFMIGNDFRGLNFLFFDASETIDRSNAFKIVADFVVYFDLELIIFV